MTIPDIKHLHRTNISEKSISNNYPEFHEFINNKYDESIKWLEKLYLYYNNMNEQPKCPTCGKPSLFISFFKGYRIYCSQKCSYTQDRSKKISDTIEKKYGVRHALQSSICRQKYEETSIIKYGVRNISLTDEYKAKFKKTMIDEYGGIGSSSNIIKDKVIKTRRQNRLNNDIIKGQIGYTEDGKWIMKCPYNDHTGSICDNCDKTYIISPNNYFDRLKMDTEPCTKLLPICNNLIKGTTIEIFIRNILDKHNIEYLTNVRNIISPKEVDIYIPSKNIAIECNGLFWHSKKESTYHIEKFKACQEKGIQLLTLWEDWIRTKPEIVESVLLSKLGIYNNKIYARKCDIREVDSKICNKFLNENHIQGRSTSTIRYGLYYNNELVSVMTFSKSRIGVGKNEDGFELVRFCNKKNTLVIGGASKLFKHFIKQHNPNQIVSYSSNDISIGNLYKTLGFTNEYKINQSYWYIQQGTFERFHRYNFRKDKLKEMGYDIINLTEREIMSSLPYYRIYDSGTIRWVYELL